MMIDTKELRELAEAATQGEWTTDVWIDSNSYGWRATGPHHENDDSDDAAEPGCPDEQAAQRDAAFIAAVNPQTVLALLDEIDELDEECRLCADIAAEYGCLPADAPHDAVRSLGNKVEDLQDEVRKLRQATSHTGAAYLVDAAVSVQRERDELRNQLAAMTEARDRLADIAQGASEVLCDLGDEYEEEAREELIDIAELRKVGSP